MKSDFDIHSGTWLLYPTRRDVWRKNAQPIAETVVRLAETIGKYEPTFLGVLPTVDQKSISSKLGNSCVVQMLYNDIWVRDTGAIPCKYDLVKFGFNAWGGSDGLYCDWSLDSSVPEQMCKILQKNLRSCPLVIEGGNLVTDGKGTIITIKRTLCNKNRNPNVDSLEASNQLKEALGIEKVVLIDDGLVFDETGGHIDNLCAFANSKTILLAWTEDKNSPQYDVVRRALTTLEIATNAYGEHFDIIKIPLPEPFQRTEDDCVGIELCYGSKERCLGEWIQPSYINFVFANGAVIVPVFGTSTDDEALNIFKKVFYDREVIPFSAREVTLGGGGLHCITKNF